MSVLGNMNSFTKILMDFQSIRTLVLYELRASWVSQSPMRLGSRTDVFCQGHLREVLGRQGYFVVVRNVPKTEPTTRGR